MVGARSTATCTGRQGGTGPTVLSRGWADIWSEERAAEETAGDPSDGRGDCEETPSGPRWPTQRYLTRDSATFQQRGALVIDAYHLDTRHHGHTRPGKSPSGGGVCPFASTGLDPLADTVLLKRFPINLLAKDRGTGCRA